MNKALFLNRFFTSFADYGLMFLIPLSVFQLTESAALAGLAFSIEYLVKVGAGPLAGVIVDRTYLVLLLNRVNGIRALACWVSAFWLLVAPGIMPLVLLAVFNGLGFTLNFLAQETLLTDLVPRNRFAKIQAQIQSLEQVALVAAPMLASALLVWVPVAMVLGVLGCLYGASLGLLMLGTRRHVLATPPDLSTPLLASVKDNFRVGQTYLLRSTALRKVVASTFLINLIFATILAIGAPAIMGVFSGSSQDFANLQAGGAVAAVIVLFFVSRFSHRLTSTGWGRIAFTMMSLGGVMAALASQLPVFIAGAILVLAFDGMFNVYIRTRRMEIIERRDYGKAMGLLMIVNNLSKPVSGLLVFLLAPWFSVQVVLLFATLVAVVCTLVFRLFSVSVDVPELSATDAVAR